MSEDATIKHSVHSRIAEKAAFLGLGALFSKFLGLFRDLLIAQTMPLGVSDPWVLAFRIPHFLRRISSEGLMNASLFGQKLTLLSFMKWTLCWSVFVVFLLFLRSPLLQLLETRVDSIQLAADLFLGMGGYLWSLGICAYLLAAAHQRGQLWQVALTPVLFNLVVVAALLSPLGLEFRLSHSLSWAGVFQLLLLLPELRHLERKTGKPSPLSLQKVTHFTQTVAAFSYLQFLGFFSVIAASQLSEGSVSFFFWAERLLEFPLALISTSLGLAGVAQLKAPGKGQTEYLSHSVKWLFPSAVGLLLARQEVILLLFGKGHFSIDQQAQLTSLMVPFSFLLFFLGLYKMNLWILVAQEKMLPLKILVAHLSFAMVLTFFLQSQSGFQIQDLGFAYVLCAAVLCGHSFLVLMHRQEILTSLKKASLHAIPSVAAMGLLTVVIQTFFEIQSRGGAAALIAASSLTYFVFFWVIKRMIPERGTLG